MTNVVFDSSAILAAIRREPGMKMVFELAPFAVVSAVNLAEVKTKLIDRGMPEPDARTFAASFTQSVVAFDHHQADLAGSLVSATRPLGLSLGDRACLALATTLKAAVYTTDQAWGQLEIGVPIHLLR